MDLASTKSGYSSKCRVQNLIGEYEIEVTRQYGEYEFFLVSNSALPPHVHEKQFHQYMLRCIENNILSYNIFTFSNFLLMSDNMVCLQN